MHDWTGHVRPRLASLRLDPTREAEIIEELSQHLDQRFEELMHQGANEQDARRLASEELLDMDTLARLMRPLRQASVPPLISPGAPRRFFLRDLGQDLRYATRVLRLQPGFAAAAIITLALGIGANNAIFALVDATLLRPLPFPNPDRLVLILERTERAPRGAVALSNLADWSSRAQSFDALGGVTPNVGSMVLSARDGTAESVPRQWVTSGYFDTLGVRPIAGRTFLPADDTGRRRGVVLSEALWRTQFNADPAIVGADIKLDGEAWIVLGVVPPHAQLYRTSIWALRSIQGLGAGGRSQYSLLAIGRMKPGVTIEAARSELEAVAAGLAREFPTTNAGRSITIEPLHEAVVGTDLRQTSFLFLAVVGFVLLICCANVASLMLTRATARTRELAMRSALGADRFRIMRQLLAESVMLSAIGGFVGLGLGALFLDVASAVIPEGLLPPAVSVGFDLRVTVFCAASTLVVGVICGLVPAWQATRLSSAHVLSRDGRTSTSHGGRIRTVLVGAQLATAVVLLVGAGLLLRTLAAVEGVDRGYRAESVLTMIVDPSARAYPTGASLLQFYEAVAHEINAQPGVHSVGWATTLPMGRSYQSARSIEILDGERLPEGQRPTADYQIVSPGYFNTVDLPLVAGRSFDARDTSDGHRVCIVNEVFVRRHLDGRPPIGVRVALRFTANPRAEPIVREIVGVARQVKGRPDETDPFAQIYVPLAQDTPGDIFLLVRPDSGRAEALTPSVRAAMTRVDTQQLVNVRSVMTLEDVTSTATARHRFRAALVVAFATVSLLLTMVGLFGNLAYTIQRRVRELAVRRALGATTADVLWLVARNTAAVIAVGAIVGLVTAAALARLLTTMLFAVRPLDVPTFISVIALVVLTAIAATIGPAWRGARIDPALALKSE